MDGHPWSCALKMTVKTQLARISSMTVPHIKWDGKASDTLPNKESQDPRVYLAVRGGIHSAHPEDGVTTVCGGKSPWKLPRYTPRSWRSPSTMTPRF